ncbi:MAG TPA: c-type cytochrome [Saprospiraceae bacterium]|nr:c-type cytochrome [Saprospiraceae bacterium]
MKTTKPNTDPDKLIVELANAVQKLLAIIFILVILLLLSPVIFYYGDDLVNRLKSKPVAVKPLAPEPTPDKDLYWIAPETGSSTDSLVLYGKELIAHTAKYLGPAGTVATISNGMNCQNCHLDAGTRVFGNNYGSVASTYPKFRARSGASEDIYKRVNDCMERSLNGKALDTLSREMQAIKSYLEFLGSNVKKGEMAAGSGLKPMGFLNRPADPVKGKAVYDAKCLSCHQANGEGMMHPDGKEYLYPPLWGPHSYNDGAGLYRLSNFAKYVKYNMPLGVRHDDPQLSDEESWDVAAFVNSQPRPHKKVPKDWPDISKKPVDHPFGPFADGFSETQHKYGPFQVIVEARSDKEKKKQ